MKFPTPCLASLSVALIALLSSPSASLDADEVKGVEVPNKISIGDSTLVLNGTAVRSVLGFGVYVVALYLAEPNRDHLAIMTRDKNPKRIHITMLRAVPSDKFESTILDNVEQNFSAKEKVQFAGELKQFLGCFKAGSVLKKGSVVNIDFQAGLGTAVTVDGKAQKLIAGDEFYHALLRLWIGEPLQESIKQGLLRKKG